MGGLELEEFKIALKKRISLLSTFCILAITFIAAAGIWGYNQIDTKGHVYDAMHGFQVGLFTGFLFIMLRQITKYKKALEDDEKIKLIYIEQNDERKKLISDKIGGVGYNFVLGALVIALVAAGFFSEIIFLTLASVLLFMALVKGYLKYYYNKKY